MKLDEAKKKFEGQWIAFRASGKETNPDGEVLLHKQNRREFDKELLQRGIKDVYLTYSGPPIPPGYAAFFN
jgi:hypothetical protein